MRFGADAEVNNSWLPPEICCDGENIEVISE